MPVIRRFVEWLSYHPTTEEIARALATEYFAEFSVRGLRFGRINNDDSITNLGQFGFPDSENIRGRNIPSQEWRSGTSAEIDIVSGKSKEKWTPDSTIYVATLRDRGVIQGHLIILFHNAIPESQKHQTSSSDRRSLCATVPIPFLCQQSIWHRGHPFVGRKSRCRGGPADPAPDLDSAGHGRGQDQPRASHRNGLFRFDHPPRDHADLPGALSQRPQGSGQKGHHAQPGVGHAQTTHPTLKTGSRHAQTLNAGFTLAHPID
jgi:hypothetical protein